VAHRGTALGTAGSHSRHPVVVRPALLETLAASVRVTLLSAPAGSGKTSLLRSWSAEPDVAERVAWVTVGRRERDPQRFWLALLDALRATHPGSRVVGAVTPGREFDPGNLVERLLEDLSGLDEPLWLVLDDLHELDDPASLEQLETLVTEAPPELRFVLAARHDPSLGLHRLRLEGQLQELRAADLRFTAEEASQLLETAGVEVSSEALAQLMARTEGWAAGLRLAALSLASHPDPERFAADFSGSERTVAEYLLAEVLERQPAEVRRLLLRTSILEQVTGALADRLTGGNAGARILDELEQTGAFVTAIDPQRTTFRFHRLFRDLLALELRRTAPDELPALHVAAAEWFAAHGVAVEAIRHAQAARRWDLAARLLSDSWLGLYLDGQRADRHEALCAFPPEVVARDAELAAVAVADEVTSGSLDEAARHLAIATRGVASVPEERRRRLEATLATLRLLVARARNDAEAVTIEATKLLAAGEGLVDVQAGLREDLRALVLVSLGTAALWTGHSTDAERHLEEALALSRRIGRPLLELGSLSHLALVAGTRSLAQAERRSQEAIKLGEAHGWPDDPLVALAQAVHGIARLWRGRLDEAEQWIALAERGIRAERYPAAAVMLRAARGRLELVRGRFDASIAAFRAAQRAGEMLASPDAIDLRVRGHLLIALLRAGDVGAVDLELANLDEARRDVPEIRIVTAARAVDEGRPEDAVAALAPIVDPSALDEVRERWMIQALLLEAIARDALGDPGAVGRALERALDLAEPEGMLLPFLLFPAPALLERHARSRTAHAALLADVRALLAGRQPSRPATDAARLADPLSEAELRVLRYLPTNLRAPEIAGELFVSVTTVRTHTRHIYTKLGVHQRAEAVDRARELGLLAPSSAAR
jgi:LuxR family maltose regulon positive regulatory protein